MRVGRVLAAGAALVVAVLAASGCGPLGGESGYVSRTNGACEKAAAEIDELPEPREAGEAIGYALDVFTRTDRLVSQLREAALPDEDADALRSRWLDPAQRSLEAFRPELERIRAASVARDEAATRRGLAALEQLGRQGVDGSLLADYGLTECVPLFAPTDR